MAGEVTDYQLIGDKESFKNDSKLVFNVNEEPLNPALLGSDPGINGTAEKPSPPPGYESIAVDQDKETPQETPYDQEGSQGSTQEYQREFFGNGSISTSIPSSRTIDPDLFDEEDENDVLGLQPAKPVGHNLHFTRSARLLLWYGVTCVLVGVAISLCGVASFAVTPRLESRHSFLVEWKWTNLMVILTGFSAILLVYRQTLTAICCTLMFSLVAMCMGVCTVVVHLANFLFRRKDVGYYTEHGEEEMASIATTVGNINLGIMVLGAVSTIVSCLVYRHSLHVTGKNFGYTLHIDRHRLRLSMLGLCQIICGMLITAWWVGIETLFHGKNIDFHSLPTSEVLAHGIVISICGYIQMMATAKGNQPLLVCAAALNGASFLLATFFSARPLSLIYLITEHSSSEMTDSFDIRFAMCAFLCLFYLGEIMFSVYSLIKFVHLAASDRISRIDNLLDQTRQIFVVLSCAQIFVGVLYGILEIIAVSALFLYKLDFSPLPLFVIGSGIFSYGAVTMGSTMLITVTTATASLCAAFSFRDIYLFGYHTISHGLTPDNPTSMRMSSGSLAMHFLLALVAFIEIILAVILQITLFKALFGSVAGIFNKMEFPRVLKYLRIISTSQIVVSCIIILLGCAIFFSRTEYLLAFGDHSIAMGLLLLTSGILSIFVIRDFENCFVETKWIKTYNLQ